MIDFMRIVEVERKERFKKSKQLSLGGLIKKVDGLIFEEGNNLEEVRYDFCNFYPDDLHSWRGSYQELSLNYQIGTKPMKPIDFLDMLKNAIGKSFEGYKGGDFIMHEESPIWISEQDYSGNTAVMDVVIGEAYQIILVTGYMEY